MSSGGVHTAFASLFARGLVAAGVRSAIVSPGSRSTPLALAFAQESGLELTVAIDERAAGFMALGRARVTGLPTVVLTTSGTAAAHHHPAILEADRAKIPLVVVTADRPPELAHAHASQTVDQTKMFGAHVRVALDLGLPSEASLAAALRIAAQAVATSLGPDPGPVHVNAPFRKPLEPVDDDDSAPYVARAAALLERGGPTIFAGHVRADDGAIERATQLVEGAERPLVVLGPRWGGGRALLRDRELVLVDASRQLLDTGVPVIAEATSGAFGFGAAIDGAALADAGGLCGDSMPDVVVAVGMPPVSQALGALAPRHKIVVAPAGFPDPEGTATMLVHGDGADVLARIAAGSTSATHAKRRGAYRARLERRALLVSEAYRIEACEGTALTEPYALHAVARALPPGSTLMIGNSLVVRDLDAFGAGALDQVSVAHQRGAAGIDGLLAGAAGVRLATDAAAPVAVVLGDVSALHDVGALSIIRALRGPLAIVVIDNAGGRIFESLPLAKHTELASSFERLFLTPPPPFIEGVARAFEVAYVHVDRRDALTESLRRALSSSVPVIVHVIVPPSDGTARRARARGAAKRALEMDEPSHG